MTSIFQHPRGHQTSVLSIITVKTPPVLATKTTLSRGFQACGNPQFAYLHSPYQWLFTLWTPSGNYL
jgi:hypothetical protein